MAAIRPVGPLEREEVGASVVIHVAVVPIAHGLRLLASTRE